MFVTKGLETSLLHVSTPFEVMVGLDHHYDSLLWKLWKLGKNEFLGSLLITFWEQGINFKLLRAKFNDPPPQEALTLGSPKPGQYKTRSADWVQTWTRSTETQITNFVLKAWLGKVKMRFEDYGICSNHSKRI